MPFTTHLESAIDGTRFDCQTMQTLHQGRPLWVRYDLPAVAVAMSKQLVALREPTLWRYRELLPVNEGAEVTFGEGMSPLLACPVLGERLGVSDLWIKDESQLPGGSFKSRGMALAISMAKHFGVRRVALPTAGNAGGAAAMYAARAGLDCYVFMPRDTPVVNQYEASLFGAKAYLIDGLINACGKVVREGAAAMNWFDLSTLKEPYRIEGKKTMGLELAEQFNWQLPDVILYPTGGGTGLIGMWKAFQELRDIGWLNSDKMPKMVSVQSDGCCPIVRAFEQGARFAEPFANAATIASGLRVPVAIGDFMILDAIRESGGTAVAVPEASIRSLCELSCRAEGISVCPEAATCVGALAKLRAEGFVKPHERVVIFNTGAAQKYVEAIYSELPTLDISQPIDWTAL